MFLLAQCLWQSFSMLQHDRSAHVASRNSFPTCCVQRARLYPGVGSPNNLHKRQGADGYTGSRMSQGQQVALRDLALKADHRQIGLRETQYGYALQSAQHVISMKIS